jgi:hypothetical protein
VLLVAVVVFGRDKVWRGGCREIGSDATTRLSWGSGERVMLASTVLRQQSKSGFCSPNYLKGQTWPTQVDIGIIYLQTSHPGDSCPMHLAGHVWKCDLRATKAAAHKRANGNANRRERHGQMEHKQIYTCAR